MSCCWYCGYYYLGNANKPMALDPKIRWSRRKWLGACAVAPSLLPAETSAPARKLRVLLVTGGHDHPPSFYSLFTDQSKMDVNVNPHPGAFRSDGTGRYDVVVLYDLVQLADVDEPRRRNFQKFVEGGKGVVVLHHALCSYNQWEWWWREVAGVRYLAAAEGHQPASSYRHDEKLTITPVRSHPILEGVGTLRFTDETYKDMWFSKSNEVLLRTDNPTSDGPAAWISAYEKSRVVVIQPGHAQEAHQHPGYRRLVRNAIFWAGGAASNQG